MQQNTPIFAAGYYSESDDEDGMSDDNEYLEFKEKLKANRLRNTNVDSEADQKTQQLRTAFSAITFGNLNTLIESLDNGLNVDIDLELGWTPLLVASTVANLDIISALIARGANIHQSRESTTPLMLLCNIISTEEKTEENILSCVKLLVDKGVDVNVCDNKRRTAIMFAAYNGHLETVKFLLPLVDKEAEDNQRWNVLFWAVDGNHLQVVETLLEEDCNYEKKDIRGNTVVDLAHQNGFNGILNLFPKDPFDELYNRMNNNNLNFVETFENLKQNEKPQFFSDVCKILYGTKSEKVMPIFYNNNLGLFELLSLTDDKLKNIGVQFPFQRNRIMGGLYKFHKHPFKPQSIPFIKKDYLFTNIDVSVSVLTCVKQLTTMEASLKFLEENSREKLTLAESKEVNILISKLRQQIHRLKRVSEKLVKKSEQWDATLKPADRITKKRRNIPWCNVFLSFGIISAFILYKFM